MAGADKISGRTINSTAKGMGRRKFALTHFRQSEHTKDVGRRALVPSRWRRGLLPSTAPANTDVMRQALELLPSRLGHLDSFIGVAEAGKEISTRPFPARHRAQLGAARPAAVPRAAPTFPRSSTGT